MNGKFHTVMVDGASKYQRSILGIYLQYMVDSRIVIRCAGMVNLTSKHTGVFLANTVLERLKILGIKTSQLVAITTDNGPNMTCMIDRLNDAFGEDDEVIDNDYDKGDSSAKNQDEENDSQFVFSTDKDYNAILKNIVKEAEIEELCSVNYLDGMEDPANLANALEEIQKIIKSTSINIYSIRCAAHTLQLAVLLALSDTEIQHLVVLCRSVCKTLRTKSTQDELKQMVSFRSCPVLT